MNIRLLDVETNQQVPAAIVRASWHDLPQNIEGWNFSWRRLFRTEGTEIYKVSLLEQVVQVQGLLMLSVMNNEMVYMNMIEVAPQNVGVDGRYDNVAGCLIAYGCMRAFEAGKNNYEGYLTFESKTELIELYECKYGAKLAAGQRMFIDPAQSLHLIDKYLDLKL